MPVFWIMKSTPAWANSSRVSRFQAGLFLDPVGHLARCQSVRNAGEDEAHPVARAGDVIQRLAVFSVERDLAGKAGDGIGDAAHDGALIVQFQAFADRIDVRSEHIDGPDIVDDHAVGLRQDVDAALFHTLGQADQRRIVDPDNGHALQIAVLRADRRGSAQMRNGPFDPRHAAHLVERGRRQGIGDIGRPADRVHDPDFGLADIICPAGAAFDQIDEDRQLLRDEQGRKGDTEHQSVELLLVAGQHPDGDPEHWSKPSVARWPGGGGCKRNNRRP